MTLPDCSDDSGPSSPAGGDDSPRSCYGRGGYRGCLPGSTVAGLQNSVANGNIFVLGTDVDQGAAPGPTGRDWVLALVLLGGFAWAASRK
jgi:hypothetical protein